MPAVGPARQDGRQGVQRLVRAQSGGAVCQGHVPGDHGVDDLQVPMPRQRPQSEPHLVVVAGLQHHDGDGAGSPACWRPNVPSWSRHTQFHDLTEVISPLLGLPTFPGRQATVQRDVEGVRPQLWRSRFPPPGLGAGQGLVGGAMSMCAHAGEVRYPNLLLVRLLEVGPRDPHVNVVLLGWVLPGWGALGVAARRC